MNDIFPSSLAAARSTAEIATAHSSRYLQQLCKHFAHKRPVVFDKETGSISLSAGDCRLSARAGTLRLALAADDAESLLRLQETVERHLVRFAFREEMRIEWQIP